MGDPIPAVTILILAIAVFRLWLNVMSLNRRLLDQRARMDVFDAKLPAYDGFCKTTTECVLNLHDRVKKLETRVDPIERTWVGRN